MGWHFLWGCPMHGALKFVICCLLKWISHLYREQTARVNVQLSCGLLKDLAVWYNSKQFSEWREDGLTRYGNFFNSTLSCASCHLIHSSYHCMYTKHVQYLCFLVVRKGFPDWSLSTLSWTRCRPGLGCQRGQDDRPAALSDSLYRM